MHQIYYWYIILYMDKNGSYREATIRLVESFSTGMKNHHTILLIWTQSHDPLRRFHSLSWTSSSGSRRPCCRCPPCRSCGLLWGCLCWLTCWPCSWGCSENWSSVSAGRCSEPRPLQRERWWSADLQMYTWGGARFWEGREVPAHYSTSIF